jgi:DNA-binding response OmpR family regulator
VVDGDPRFSALLSEALSAKGYRVRQAAGAAGAIAMLQHFRPTLIVMDLMLPDANGLVLCAELKARTGATIIVCSGTKRKEDPVLAFKLGASDFIAKPISLNELESRMERTMPRAVTETRSTLASASDVEQIGELIIDRRACEVRLGGRLLQLTPTEYQLMCEVASRPGAVFSRRELARTIWGSDDRRILHSLEVHMRRLRAKLETGRAPHSVLVTRRGLGYQLMAPPEHQPAAASWEPHNRSPSR